MDSSSLGFEGSGRLECMGGAIDLDVQPATMSNYPWSRLQELVQHVLPRSAHVKRLPSNAG